MLHRKAGIAWLAALTSSLLRLLPSPQAQLADSSERLLSVFESLPAAEQVLSGPAQQQAGQPAAAGQAVTAAVASVYTRLSSWCGYLFGRSGGGSDAESSQGGGGGGGGGGPAQQQREAQAARLEALLARLGAQQAEQQLLYLSLLSQQQLRLELLLKEVARGQHCLLSAARRGLLTRGAAPGSSDKVTLLDVVELAAAGSRQIAHELLSRATGRLLNWSNR